MLRKSTTIALSLIGALTLGIPSATAVINIGVSPPRFELKINRKSTTQSIRVVNLSSKPVELKAYVRSWKMSEDNKLVEIPSTEESLAQWIIFTPSQFTIPPRGAQTVRFSIRPRVQPKPGEHRAVMFLEEIPPTQGKTKGVRTVGRLAVAIYGYVGDIKKVGAINSIRVNTELKAPTAVFDISNTGNGHIRLKGQYAIWQADKYPGAEVTKPIDELEKPGKKIPAQIIHAGILPISPILPDHRSRISLPISKKLPPGKYVLDLNGELNGIKIDQGIPFTIPVQTTSKKSQTQTVNSGNLKTPLQSR
ncbi:molecular chaperone [Pelatocladus sp. BLCC-F211]|uniref:fimbrial biogenesis chaperone n=1 Tax=Pelatocladus sp. BLCC-F211 TaxID=3342752 RepID=UPI0035B7B0C3